MLLACIQWDDPFGKDEDGNCAANDLLDVASNDGNLDHDPHQQPGDPGVLCPAMQQDPH